MKIKMVGESRREMANQDGWQEVRRRRKYPDNWRHSSPPQPNTKPYTPFSTYAQVLCRNLHPTAPSTNGSNRASPTSSRPSSPATPKSAVYYVSPHSPSHLRFPPSPSFLEWRGRCFKCCRTGHTAATCRNPRRCGRCWSDGHIGSRCKQVMVPPPAPTPDQLVPRPPVHTEPAFEELLTGSYPYRSPEMPTERPLRLHCFIEQDEDYHKELDKLKNAVVVNTHNFEWELSTDNVGDYAVRTNLVTREEIQVSELSGSRFLIVLPPALDPDTFINATPQSAWDEGINFQPWSPLDEAAISIPAYKVLLRLRGVPPPLWREKNVAQAVARFGVYLGSVKPENPASLASWIAAVGVDDLSLVPVRMAMHLAGLIYEVDVFTIAWKRTPLYTAAEMPKHPKKYTRPQPPPPSPTSEAEPMEEDHEPIAMSRRVLRDVCRGRTADSLPPELRQFATMEVIPMEDPHGNTNPIATENLPAADQEVHTENQNVRLLIRGATDREQTQPLTGGMAGQVMQTPVRILSNRRNQATHNPASNTVRKETNLLIRTSAGKQAGSGEVGHQTPKQQPPHKDTQGPQPRIIRRESDHARRHTSGKATERGESSRGRVATHKGISRARNGTLILFSAGGDKDKGPARTPNRANNSGPSSTEATLKEFKRAVRKKRKTAGIEPSGPANNTPITSNEEAAINFNSAGYYEIRVQQNHISNLAAACGFKNRDVSQVVQMDNTQRQNKSAQCSQQSDNEEEEEDYDLSRFDPDPNDELTSDEE